MSIQVPAATASPKTNPRKKGLRRFNSVSPPYLSTVLLMSQATNTLNHIEPKTQLIGNPSEWKGHHRNRCWAAISPPIIAAPTLMCIHVLGRGSNGLRMLFSMNR